MKNTGSCPKCHSSDIARVPAEPGGSPAPAGPLGVLAGVALTRFVCCRCGYSEEWADDLAGVKKRYGRPPRGEPPLKG